MAQAVQNGRSFIDLTSDDENDDAIAKTNAAYQKAFAAASRMTTHFESLKSPMPFAYRNPCETVDLTGMNSLSTSVHQSLMPPRLGTFPKPSSDTEGVKKDRKNNPILRSNPSVPSPGISAAQLPRPAISPSRLPKTESDRQQPRETKSLTLGTSAFTIRTPRSAAISAKQNIAETCSELEEWVNKDPNLITQQTGVSTPRRLGKTNDDLDEWSPSPNSKDTEEGGKEWGGILTKSPTPSAGKYEDLPVNGYKSSSHTGGVSSSLGTKKRRFSGSSQAGGPLVKLARWNEEPSAYHESSSNLAEPVDGKLVRDEIGNEPLTKSPGKITVSVNDKLLPQPSNAELKNNRASTKPTVLPSQVTTGPTLQRGFHVASDPSPSELGPYPASPGNTRYIVLFDSVVYPTIKKSKKRHKDALSQEELDAIGKNILDEVLKKLASHPENSELNEDTKKKIKQFVKKSFRQRVRKANTKPLHDSVAPAQSSKPGTGTLSSSSSGLGHTTAGESVSAGGHPPPISRRDHPENGFSSPANVGGRTEEAQASQQPSTTPLHQQLSSPLQQSPSESPTSFFAHDFDRGRYPALRRRRGNKHFTPTKTTKKGSKLEKSQSISSEHNSSLGLSNGKDQVRLLKALANQPSTLHGSATQLTALTSTAETKRTPQESTLELPVSEDRPTHMGDAASEHASYADASKALRQIMARKRLQEDTAPQKEPRPIFRLKPATALSPSLEHVVAVLVTDTHNGPSEDGQKYSVTPANQKQLVAHESIVKYVDFTSKVGKPNFVRIETKVIDPMRRPGSCISSLLRNRELGLTSHGHVGTIDQLRQLKSEMLEPWKKWKGASGDVVAVAWHPGSNVYAFGAAAHTNVEDIQYNRPCNLLLGNLSSNQVRELPDHRVDRPRPETIPNGPNSTQAVYDACDPKVYETVTSIAFSPTGSRMLTASHDCTVKIWDVSTEKYQCLSTLRHEAWVTSLEISEHQPGVFATASKCVKDAVRIYRDPSCYVSFSASRAEARPESKIYPECLRWCPNPSYSHLLLAGFQQWEQQGDLLSGGGQLCLYDAYAFKSEKVTPSSQSVYAASWHPTERFFATGGAPGNNVTDKINTKTVVRVWDVRTRTRCHVEYECPATDMQDITFSPFNSNIVTAGCTDGSSYVWDWRWPDQLLHRLKHGRPLAELDHTREREEADTGVMLSLWGPDGSLFYTGSSDGMIKAWDVRRHPNDVLISNVANFDVSIQSGAFSPDGDHLLIGDAEGGIHVLSSAPCGPRSNIKSMDAHIDLVRASDGSGMKLDDNDDNPGTEGIEAARSLVESDQLQYHKEFGVEKGLNYQGPYAVWARKETGESPVGRLRKKYEKKQPISKRGEKRWDIAIPMTSLLHERKKTLDRERDGNRVALDGLNERGPKTNKPSKGRENLPTYPFYPTKEGALTVGLPSAGESVGASVVVGDDDHSVEHNTLSESEMIEENHWWPRMGEEEIEQARAGRVKD